MYQHLSLYNSATTQGLYTHIDQLSERATRGSRIGAPQATDGQPLSRLPNSPAQCHAAQEDVLGGNAFSSARNGAPCDEFRACP